MPIPYVVGPGNPWYNDPNLPQNQPSPYGLASAGTPGIYNFSNPQVNPGGFGGETGIVSQENGGYLGIPGYGYNVMNLANQYAMQQQGQQGMQSQQLAAQSQAAAQQLAELQARHQMELQTAHEQWQGQQNQIQQAFDQQQKELDRQLQLQLQNGTITAQAAQQARDLAQRESEFARTLAMNKAQQDFQQHLDTMKFQHDSEIQNAQMALNSLAEARQERQLQANLAANPKDFVAYNYYMRGLGSPQQAAGSPGQNASQTAWALAQQFANGQGTPAGTPPPANTPTAQAGNPGSTNDAVVPPPIAAGYTPSAPSYSDQTLSDLYSATRQGQPGYNPGMSGKGAFGTNIVAPNMISRAQYNSMTPTDIGIMSSFLNAGVDTGGGHMAGINPDDYFAQMSRSFIPTMSDPGERWGNPSYSTGSGGSSYLSNF